MSEDRNGLPAGWAWATFDDVAEVEANLVDPADHMDAAHVAPNHIESGTGRLLPYQTIQADAVTSPKHLFRPGQILYSKIRPYLAKAVRVNFEGLCSADMYPVRSDIDTGFLHQWLVSPMFTVFASQSQGRSLLPKINQQALATKPIPVAPLPEQKRIVAKIESLQARSDAAKQALDAIPPLLDKLRQSVLAAAFRGDLTRAWREAHPDVEPASELLERIRAERRRKWEQANPKKKYVEPEPVDAGGLPELPEGWCWASLEEVSSATRSICYGVVQPGGDEPGGVPLVRVCDIVDGVIETAALRTVPKEVAAEYERSQLEGGEVLVTVVGTIGRVGIAQPSLRGANIARAIARIVPVELIGGPWIYFALQSPRLQEGLVRESREVARKTLNIGTLARVAVPLAPQEETMAIVEHVRRLLVFENQVRLRVTTATGPLDQLNQSILAKAFRGELVPQDPTDEPASVLLERIRTARETTPDPKRPAKRPRKPKSSTQ